MIMFKLLLIPLFIVVVIGVIYGVKHIYKWIDTLEVKEKKEDIEHDAELVDDVDNYTLHNKGKMRKASSDSVEEFKKS